MLLNKYFFNYSFNLIAESDIEKITVKNMMKCIYGNWFNVLKTE